MLAVVVLLPIVLMVTACLLERFEAHATRVAPAPRVRRPVTREPAAPALALVPGTDRGADVTDVTATTTARELRPAS